METCPSNRAGADHEATWVQNELEPDGLATAVVNSEGEMFELFPIAIDLSKCTGLVVRLYSRDPLE